MMYSVWFYRFKPGTAANALDQLRTRGREKVYPGCTHEGGTFLGRVWGHTNYTHASVFPRENIAAARAEAEDADNLLRNLRILSPALAAMEIRNHIERDDPELVSLGEDEWHTRVVTPFVDAAEANPEVAYHLNAIGFSCLSNNTFPPYPVQAVWRAALGYPQKWLGGSEPRAGERRAVPKLSDTGGFGPDVRYLDGSEAAFRE